VLVTHGFSDSLARVLRETRGLDASVLPTRFAGEAPPDDAAANAADDDGSDDDAPATDLAAEADA
jgi:hypothetical protein